ncbi:PaaI family thioesterase [Variovorax sp. LjRoot84]|uniref:PaaI family thioesterase n=1 Tax=Variovorax sp. LjRoot84 TaxID=3342340 RepID=UPI003ED02CDC
MDDVPEGFEPASIGGHFASRNGPLHARWHGGHLLVGFRVGPPHVNPMNACHGGMLATVADILLSTAAQYQTPLGRRFLPTISLQIDYLAGAKLGDWVEGRADILRTTRNLLFSQGLLTVDGAPILRASGVFKIGPPTPFDKDDAGLQLPGMPITVQAAQ